jgi:zinc transport system permease protein
MTDLLSALQYDFMQNALMGSLLLSLMCAITGTFIVIKRLVFLSGGISHGAFAGLGAAYYLGINPVLGAMVLFVFITPGYAPDLMPYLFGDILTISHQQLIWMVIFSVLSLVLTVLLFRQLVAVSFDDEFARLRGLPVTTIMILLMVMNSVAIVMMIQAVGIILVMALLTIPPLIGLALAAEIRLVMFFAFVSALLITVGGLFLSFLLDLPSGPAIVLLGAGLLMTVKLSLGSFTS